MATADADFLDRAIDNAMDTLAEKEVVEASPEPERASQAEDPVETTETAKQTETSKGRSRDQSGKFTKAQPEAAAEEAAPEQSSDQEANAEAPEAPAQEEPSQGDNAPIDAPAFWSADEKALYAKADPALRRVIAAREAQRNEWANRLQSDASYGKAFREQVYADFESPEAIQAHKDALRSNGVTNPIEELHRYRAWDRVFRTNPKAHIGTLMQRNNLTPYDFFEDQGQQQFQTQTDPRVEEALSRADKAQKSLDEYLENQKKAVATQYLQTFASGKDSRGNVRASYYNMYRPQIAQAMQEIRSVRPDLPEEQALEHAYEFVVGEVFKLHGTPAPQVAPGKTTEQKIADAKKAKAAATSTTGAPSSGVPTPRPRLKGKTFDERLDSAIDMAFEHMDSQR